jgi:hypothetical protein
MPVPSTWRKYEYLLRLPFQPHELEWKIQSGSDKYGARIVVVPYVDARAIRRRLDDVFGVFGHQFLIGHIPGNAGQNPTAVVGTLQILRPDGNWITRCELCELTDIEPMKGAASGALKRVAATIGIGAYLYDFPEYVLTEKNGGVVADRADYKLGHVNYWKSKDSDKKYFWRQPDGCGEPPFGIPRQFMPSEDQPAAFAKWTFDAGSSTSLLTASAAEPAGPDLGSSRTEEVLAKTAVPLVAQSQSEPAVLPKPSSGEKCHAKEGSAVRGQPAVNSPHPVVARSGSGSIHYDKLQAGTDFNAGFCDAWNFAVGREHKLDRERFISAVSAKPLQDVEKEALGFLAEVLCSPPDAFEAAKQVLSIGQRNLPSAFRQALLNVIHTKGEKVLGYRVS